MLAKYVVIDLRLIVIQLLYINKYLLISKGIDLFKALVVSGNQSLHKDLVISVATKRLKSKLSKYSLIYQISDNAVTESRLDNYYTLVEVFYHVWFSQNSTVWRNNWRLHNWRCRKPRLLSSKLKGQFARLTSIHNNDMQTIILISICILFFSRINEAKGQQPTSWLSPWRLWCRTHCCPIDGLGRLRPS